MKKMILIVMLILPSQVLAYVYPPKFVYKKWMDTNKKITSLAYQKVYYEVGSLGQRSKIKKTESISIKRPGLVRIWDQNNEIEKRVGLQKAIVIQSGQKREISIREALEPLELLWAYNNEDALLVRVNQFYTPIHQFQWFLFNGRKHWMQGDKKDQFLLFSSESFIPKMAKKKDMIQQFIYEPINSERSLIPKKIIQFENQKPKYEITIEGLQINPRIDNNLFSTS